MSPEVIHNMQDKKENVRVRFAPSPTGALHAGSVRTALYDYFFARSNDGSFILRIEDTDQVREVEGSVDTIKESLLWLGANWDEFAIQSERLAEYKKYSDRLVEKGNARVEENGAIRFLVPEDGETSWIDVIGNREITFKNSDMKKNKDGNIEDGFIILKEDGFPTYHLANVVDDHLMEISHVIRGEEWISSTPKHLLLYKALGWKPPVFAHVPNVMRDAKNKLSKREGAKSVLDFKSEGYLSEALLNCLMLIGWSPGGDKEIFSKEEITESFSLDRVSVSPGIFNIDKLNFLNKHYIMSLDDDKLLERLYEYDPSLKDLDRDLVRKLVVPAKTRITTLADFKKEIVPFIGDAEKTPNSEVKKDVFEALSSVETWTNDEIFNPIRSLMKSKGYKLPDIYEALIGQRQGLPLSGVFEVLGKETTLALLK